MGKCYSPVGYCDQTTCEILGKCAWEREDKTKCCGHVHSEQAGGHCSDCPDVGHSFWQGRFGDEYNRRNVGWIPTNTAFFAKALARTHGIQRVIEFGAGTGQNLAAIRNLLPAVECFAVEVNREACIELQREDYFVYNNTVEGFVPEWESRGLNLPDFALTKGLLIHIPPERLRLAYDTVYRNTRRYILLAEYYAPAPTMIPYRGEPERLWKRDFAGDMMLLYPDLQLLDYGFEYHRAEWRQDDLNWFLLEKRP